MEDAAQSLVSNVGQLLAAEYRQLSGVGGEIAELRDDLDTMNALLRMQSEADEGAVDHFVRVWMKQLRELAYDAEDCIDLYLLRIKCRPGDGVRARFKHLLQTLFSRRRLAGEISALRARALAISERHARYGVNREARRRSPALPAAPMLTASASGQAPIVANNDASHRQVIGMEKQIEELAKRLKASAEGERHLKVFSIVGFGGVGKTTLAIEVCRLLEPDFPYQAFVSVSQAFEPSRDLKPLVKSVLEQIVKVKAANEKGIKQEGSLPNMDGMDILQLAKELQERLENKRYLIVIDDAWSIRAWEGIRSVVPENNYDSRIIVTTRIKAVAQACSPTSIRKDFIHHMEPLELEDSKRLFCSRVFGSINASYPEELEEVMGNILKKCGGLPLAIISIASILVGYKSSGSIEKWEMICRSIGSEMESNPTLVGMRQIVTLSFNHLPHELKGCMMYLSIFPEDYKIDKDRLLYRWIAEGLVSTKRGLTLMEIAESYWDELLSRNMIKVVDYLEDEVMDECSCKVHDMHLEVMVSKSLEANFVSLKGEQYDGMSYHRIRRLSIHGGIYDADSPPKRKVVRQQGIEEGSVEHVRSLSVLDPRGHKILDRLGKFTLLRVLDLQDCKGVTNKHVTYACQLHLLKFLSFKYTYISVVPPQVQNLQHLQMFDTSFTPVDQLPKTITKLEKLECVKVKNWTLPRGLSKMKALRDLSCVGIGNGIEVAKELGGLEQLQRLGLSIINTELIAEEVLQEIASSLSRRYYLKSLTIMQDEILSGEAMDVLHHVSTPPRLLRHLSIAATKSDRFPSWFGSLTYLTKFSMRYSEFVVDQLFAVLSELPSLKLLWVGKARSGPSEQEVVSRTSYKFPALCNLVISDYSLKIIRFEKGSMEKLETLFLRSNYSESEGSIVGIEHLTNLKKVTLMALEIGPALDLTVEQLKAENDRRHKSKQFQVVVMK